MNLTRKHAVRTALAALGAVFALLHAGMAHAREPGPFYSASAVELTGKPGTLIRHEPMEDPPAGADAYRVLYRSTGLRGEPIAVSGVVIVPKNPPPGPRPIIAWAHPTSGIVPKCAPSLAVFGFRQIQGLREMIAEGYVVASTDYPGLGTAGPHPYLVGTSEGRAVLDSVRAARMLVGEGAGNRAALWGHSQGGQAVLYAGILARTYAPDIDLVGAAAAAPATDLAALMKDDLSTAGGDNLLAMTLWSWSRVFNAPLNGVVDSGTVPIINALAEDCLESIVDILPRAAIGREFKGRFPDIDGLIAREPWRTLLAENTAGALPPAIPVLLAQGLKDDTVSPSVTAAYMKELCAKGSHVDMVTIANTGHAFIARDAATAAIGWIGNRFAGQAAPNSCAAR
jgi:acetyl esterase/lipase